MMKTATGFGLVELDLLATYTGATIPFPLKVPSFGRFRGERDELLGAAGATLRHRGLADEDGPTGLAHEVTEALRHRHGTLDLITTGPDGPVGVVAILRRRQRALLCRQPLTDNPTVLVDITSVSAESLVEAVLDHIPDVSAAKIMPLRVPAEAVRDLHTAATAHPDRNAQQLVRHMASRYGCSADDLDTVLRFGASVTGHGQLGATRVTPDRGDVRVGAELSWLDSPTGRVKISTERAGTHEWTSINPLRRNEIRTAIADLVALTRR
jgi:ESAT-6 protein secretion system EspG family protein